MSIPGFGITAAVDVLTDGPGTRTLSGIVRDIIGADESSSSSSSSSDSSSSSSGATDGAGITGEEPGIDIANLMHASAKYAQELVQQNLRATKEMSRWNAQRFPQLSEQALENAISTGRGLSSELRSEFAKTLDWLSPTWREDIVEPTMQAQQDSVALTERFRKNILPDMLRNADTMSAQAMQNISSQLRGDLPPDVEMNLRRNAAEVAQQVGVRGQAAQYLEARDLGLTSLQLMEAGLQQAPAALGLGAQGYSMANEMLQTPLRTGAAATTALASYRPPMADASSLYGNALGILSNAGLVSGNTAYTTNAGLFQSAGQLVNNAAQFNAGMQYDNTWNQRMYSLQQQALSQQQSMNQGGALGGALGSAVGFGLGAMTGNPMMMMAGAGMGGQFGSNMGMSFGGS